MSKFPDSIPLPDSVLEQRKERNRQLIRTSRQGVSIRLSIIAAELLGFVFLNSSVLLLDALSSLMDVASSLFLVLCIKLADKPPDKEHPFGHGRFEPIAGLQLGLLLVVLGGAMLFQQIGAIMKGAEGRVLHPFTWVIPLGAVILLEMSYRILYKTAKKENSPALLADAWHYRIDSINSFFAMVALILAAYYPLQSVLIDHLGAVVIDLFMMGVGAFASRKNLHQLVDRAPEQKYFDIVRSAALSVEGVRSTEKIRIQIYGPDAHVSIDIEVDPALSVDLAHKITQKVRAEIQKQWPSVRDVIVHVEPYFPGDH
jgi:cation diffusion facilitator family transporter